MLGTREKLLKCFVKFIKEIDYTFSVREASNLSRIIGGRIARRKRGYSKSNHEFDLKKLKQAVKNIERVVKENPKLGLKI